MEFADIFDLHGHSYSRENTLTSEQYKVMHAIQNCRTSVLGGHIEQCAQCGESRPSYNSCRNRHCPKCGSLAAARWLEKREAELLPVRYFHLVFTLPHELNVLIQYNKRTLYNVLFKIVWQTLNTLGQDQKRLGGQMAMLAILHTWGQNLSLHNHLHCIVPGGALKKNGQWKNSKKYLFPVQVLSVLFRGLYVSALREAYQNHQLNLPPSQNASTFDALLTELMNKAWVVYAKAPFASPHHVLNYLGRYTHKTAISNHRILSCDEQSVTFKWRDYRDGNQEKIMRLKPDEFIRRFLSHILPSGFMRIRSFGFLGNACKKKSLAQIQSSLKVKPIKPKKHNTQSLMQTLTGTDIQLCPICKQGKLIRIQEIPSKFKNTMYDTS